MIKKVTGYERITDYDSYDKCANSRFWVGVRGSYANEEVVPRAFAPSYVDKDVYAVRHGNEMSYAFGVRICSTSLFCLYAIPDNERKHIDWNGWDAENNKVEDGSIATFASIFDVDGAFDIPGEHAISRDNKAKTSKRTPRQAATNTEKVERPRATKPTPRVRAKRSTTHNHWPYRYPDDWDKLPMNVRIRRQNKLKKELAAKGMAA